MKKNNKFFIGGWYAPIADKEVFKRIKESGINVLFVQGDNVDNSCLDVEKINEYLRLADDYEINAYVQKGNEVGLEIVKQNDALFSKHKSYLGFMYYDEPPAKIYDDISSEMVALSQYFTNEIFINLFPSYATTENIFGDYEKYIKNYCENIALKNSNVKYLSFDFYPLIYGQNAEYTLAERWLHDVEIISHYGKKYKLQTHAFIQAMPFSSNEKKWGSRDRVPTYEDLSLQIYTYLAYGFKAFTYFCLGMPKYNHEFLPHQFAIFDFEGKNTPIYDSVKKINDEISVFSEYIVQSKYEKTFLLGENELFDMAKTERFKPNDVIKDLKCDGSAIVGLYTNPDGSVAIFLVNFGETSQEKEKSFTMVLDREYEMEIYCKNRLDKKKSKMLNISVEVASGALIILR